MKIQACARRSARLSLCLSFAAALLAACENSRENEPDPVLVAQRIGEQADSGSRPVPLGPQTFFVTASGEALGVNGFAFGADSHATDPAFVDGWEVTFAHILVTFDHIRLGQSPDFDPSDPTQTGTTVARADGPWAVDLHLGGAFEGKGGAGDRAVPIVAFAAQDNGSPFDPTSRYAFSYELVAASSNAKLVNLDREGADLYAQLVAQGKSALYEGTARFHGIPKDDAQAAARTRLGIRSPVRFSLALSQSVAYVNCRNPDNAVGIDGEFLRGVQPLPSGATIAQMTVHTDHMFWEQLNIEGAFLRFDPIAARGCGDSGIPLVTLEDLQGVDFTHFTTCRGDTLPAFSFVSEVPTLGTPLAFIPNHASFPHKSYAAYLSYAAASQGHLNADGICDVVRRN